MSASASATSKPLRQRLVTTLNDKAHWVTLTEPCPYDGNRQILLTTDANDAAIVTFVAAPTAEAPDAFHILFPEFLDPEPCLMRPRIAPTPLPTEVGTQAFTSGIDKFCPKEWIKKPVSHDPDAYTLHLAEEPDQAVLISHAVEFGLNRAPSFYISPTLTPHAQFVTQTVCTTCGSIWTEHSSHVCGFCRAYEADQEHIAAHGTDPMRPCECCGEPTPYGGYCSQACRWDAEGGCDRSGGRY